MTLHTDVCKLVHRILSCCIWRGYLNDAFSARSLFEALWHEGPLELLFDALVCKFPNRYYTTIVNPEIHGVPVSSHIIGEPRPMSESDDDWHQTIDPGWSCSPIFNIVTLRFHTIERQVISYRITQPLIVIYHPEWMDLCPWCSCNSGPSYIWLGRPICPSQCMYV